MKLKGQSTQKNKIKLQTYNEVDAKIMAASQSDLDPFHKLIFFNPAMKFNRTASLLIAKSYVNYFGKGVTIDGLCSTGARGIRYSLEADVDELVFIDANPIASGVCKKNLKLNKIDAEIKTIDFNLLGAHIKTPVKIIEVDAFGSAIPFLFTAINSIENEGLLGITATDYAQLAGARVKPCIRHYDAVPYNCDCGHEIGTRILMGKIAKVAASMDKAIKPIGTFFSRHAGRVMSIVENSANAADLMLEEKIGYAYFCNKCKDQGTFAKNKIREFSLCQKCEEKLIIAGPLWIGKTIDEKIVEKSLEYSKKKDDESYKQAEKMFSTLLSEDTFQPLFYDSHQLCSWAKLNVPTFVELERKLNDAGYRFSRTHYSPTGFKTDAHAWEIVEII